jgi:hypothetical protein
MTPLPALRIRCLAIGVAIAISVALTLNSPGHGDEPAKVENKPLVGAYYYPWYGVQTEALDDQWNNVFRQRLDPPQLPRAGRYRSDDPQVVEEHLLQSRRAGIDFWAVSWWGPDSPTDRVFRQHLLSHPKAEGFRFAALYESTGRLGSMDNPSYASWLSDLDFLRDRYFDHPNYLRINGRPVLFVYLTRVYFRDRGEEALKEMRAKHADVFLIGDDVFGEGYRAEWAEQFDAVTAYDVYGQSIGPLGATREAVDFLARNYKDARAVANSVNTAFAPAVAPGYNDTVIRKGHPGRARCFSDVSDSNEGEVFRAMLSKAALPNLDPRCERLLMVTSFNEWFEDTQIEATTGTAATTNQDDSSNGEAYTEGSRYEDYGDLYLTILNNLTAAPAQREP